jgi:hypothetical protein
LPLGHFFVWRQRYRGGMARSTAQMRPQRSKISPPHLALPSGKLGFNISAKEK